MPAARNGARPGPSSARQYLDEPETNLQQEALQQLVDQEAAASTAGALEELTETPVPDAAETAEHRKLIEEQVQRAQHVLEHPLVKDLLKLVGTPAYLQAMDSIQKHPNLRLLFKVEIGILIFIFLLRAWLFSRPSHWLRKIWTRTWTLALLFVAGSVIAPSLILGSLYGEVLGPLLKAFWNHFTR